MADFFNEIGHFCFQLFVEMELLRKLFHKFKVLSVRVRAGFCFGTVWFDMNRKQHTILQITNTWKAKKRGTTFMHFHVTDEGALYELIYNMSDATWRLEQIEAL